MFCSKQVEEGTWLSCDLNTCAHEPETAAPGVSPQPGAGFSQPGLQLGSAAPPGAPGERARETCPGLPGPVRPLLSCPRETFPLCPRGAVWAGSSPICRGPFTWSCFFRLWAVCLLRPCLPKPPFLNFQVYEDF